MKFERPSLDWKKAVRSLSSILSLCGLLFISFNLSLRPVSASGQAIQFTFTLDAPYSTSAGAFKPDGTLVKTIWSNVRYAAGPHTATWDGTDDKGIAVTPGSYQIRVLYNNEQYTWDGVIGNTSDSFSGAHVWHSLFNLAGSASLAISGNQAYLAVGYNEQQTGVKSFLLTDPGSPNDAAPNGLETAWTLTATDGVRYYVANTGSANDSFSSTFVVAYTVSDGSTATFSSGADLKTGPPGNNDFPSAIDAAQKDTSGTASNDPTYQTAHAATGLAVQSAGSLLAVAHGPANEVRLFDKTTGASAGTISITNPASVSFDANGDLWVLSGTTASRYTSLDTTPSVVATISGLDAPLTIAAHPSDPNIILIADAGASQQIKAFDSSGAPVWTYGQAGGYATNGPDVTNDTFYFPGGREPLAVQSDGSFWAADGDTNRILHISAGLTYLNQIEYTPGSYASTADQNNPTRVFVNYMEYQVDYSKPLQPGDPQAVGGNGSWKLVKNWGAGINERYFRDRYTWGSSGFSTVVTLSNGHTYGTVADWQVGGAGAGRVLMELTPTGLRETGIILGYLHGIYPDGSIRYSSTVSGVQTVYEQALTGFDGSNNPLWGAPTEMAHYPADGQNAALSPGAGSGNFPTTSSGITISFNAGEAYNPGDNGANTTGMHLGGFKAGGTDFLWQGSPSVNSSSRPFNEKAEFDVGDGITYAANTAMTAGRSIVYGFHGEFWYQSEADQFMHFYDDGLVVGQFGTTGDTSSKDGGILPGLGGNETSPALITASNGEHYLYTTDESQHGGSHRWHLVGDNNIQEFSGTATSGGSVTLTSPPSAFPSGLRASPAEGQIGLAWTLVPGAQSYNIKYSQTPGGPYTTLATDVEASAYIAKSLTDGQTYYFVVSAVKDGTESINSNEVNSVPVDPSSPVHPAGQEDISQRIYSVYPVSTSAQEDYPLNLETSASILGTLRTTHLGANGYIIYDDPSQGNDTSHLPAGASVSLTNWNDDRSWGGALFRLDGTNGTQFLHWGDDGFDPNSVTTQDMTISVNPGDTNWHYLSIFSPSIFANDRQFSMVVTPQGQASPSATETVADGAPGSNSSGVNSILQFLIKGPVTVTVPTGAHQASVKAVFLDSADIASIDDTYVIESHIPNPPFTLTTIDGAAYTDTATSSQQPVFAGTAPAGSAVTITVHSDPVTCLTTADSNGNWSCTFSEAIPLGNHTVDLAAITPLGQHLSLPTFPLTVTAAAIEAGSLAKTGSKTSDISFTAFLVLCALVSRWIYSTRKTRHGTC